MTPSSKFQILEATALTFLSRPLEAAKVVGIADPSLSTLIWRFPAFGPYQSWALLQGSESTVGAFLVRRVTWERSADYERAMSPLKQAAFMIEVEPSPTGQVLDAWLSGDMAARVVERVSRLTLPVQSAEKRLVLDGVVNGVETDGGALRAEWWCDGPPTWREFTGGVESLRQDLEAAVLANQALQRTALTRRAERHSG
jgi:hypothetical protein